MSSQSYRRGSQKKKSSMIPVVLPKLNREDVNSAIERICKDKSIFFRWNFVAALSLSHCPLKEVYDWILNCQEDLIRAETPEDIELPRQDFSSFESKSEKRKRFQVIHYRDKGKEYVLQASYSYNEEQQQRKSPYILRPVRKYHSCRFSRVFGSDMFFSVTYDRDTDRNLFRDKIEMSQAPYCLGTWRFLCSKLQDSKLIYIRTDIPSKTGEFLSPEFVRNWLVNSQANPQQTLSKYNSRISMAFSTTIAITKKPLQEGEYEVIDDIDHANSGNDSIMTDGCGLISFSFMKIVAQQLELVELPCAIQGRFGSCKGVMNFSVCLPLRSYSNFVYRCG